jgi:hypothetical protein
MHLEVHEFVQGAVHVHHDPHVPHIQGQSHGEVQDGHEAHQIDQHMNRRLFSLHLEVLEAVKTLRGLQSCSGCSPFTP